MFLLAPNHWCLFIINVFKFFLFVDLFLLLMPKFGIRPFLIPLYAKFSAHFLSTENIFNSPFFKSK